MASAGQMARARRQLAEAHGAQLPAHRLLRNREPELLPHPLNQINDATILGVDLTSNGLLSDAEITQSLIDSGNLFT